MPGEKTYLVLGEDGEPLEPAAQLQDPSTVISTEQTPWWSDGWASVELAGDPPKTGRPPASEIDGTRGTGGEDSAGDPRLHDRRRCSTSRRSAGSSAARRGVARGRAPVSVRPAGRGRPPSPAARRHPVPDDVLPDLPAARRRGSARSRASGLMKEMEARLAEDRDLAAAYPGRTSATSPPARRSSSGRRAGDRRHLRRRHARPGQVPARARRARARRRAAASTRSATRCSTCSATGGRRARASMTETVAAIDCGTNTIKLLVGALPDVAVRETRIVRLGQGVDATGRLADEALARTFAAIDEYAALIASTAPPGSGSARRRPPATRRTPPSSPPASASGWASPRRCCPATRRPSSRSTARCATCATSLRCRSWWSTSAAGPPS